MDSAAKAAFITSQCACMQAEIACMQEQNKLDKEAGLANTHPPHAFMDLPNRYGLGHNAVLSFLME